MDNKKVLECSSVGDKRFSAMYAKVTIFGVADTIENHYQGSKRDASGGPVKKGKPVAYIVINRRKYPAEMLTAWYRLLWIIYLDKNPMLVEYAKRFDSYHDIFRGKNTINCQADVIRDYITDRKRLLASVSGLTQSLQTARKQIKVIHQNIRELVEALEDGSLKIEDLDEESVSRLKTLLMP